MCSNEVVQLLRYYVTLRHKFCSLYWCIWIMFHTHLPMARASFLPGTSCTCSQMTPCRYHVLKSSPTARGSLLCGAVVRCRIGFPVPISYYKLSESTLMFSVDCSRVGISDVDVHILYAGEKVSCNVAPGGVDNYQVTFTPDRPGVYQIQVFCGGVEVPGESLVNRQLTHSLLPHLLPTSLIK